ANSQRVGKAMILLFLIGGMLVLWPTPYPADKTRGTRDYSRRAMALPPRRALVPEMPDAGKHHGDAVRVGSSDHVLVAHRAAWLNDRRRARLDRCEKPVGKREEGV